MDGDSKKSLKTAIIEFYKLNSSKGKEYTFKNFKNGGVHKQKEINQDIVIKMLKI